MCKHLILIRGSCCQGCVKIVARSATKQIPLPRQAVEERAVAEAPLGSYAEPTQRALFEEQVGANTQLAKRAECFLLDIIPVR